MHWFFFAALALAAAALLWYGQAVGSGGARRAPPDGGREEETFRRWLARPGVREALVRSVDALTRLMAHPELGGPGFLTVRLPHPGEDGGIAVTAQYPNIREAMYRRIVRRELDRDGLLAAGVPEALLDLSPDFETDSGGVVAVAVRPLPMEPELISRLSGRGLRQEALDLLADCLGERFPGLEARPFGGELLLTPVRKPAV